MFAPPDLKQAWSYCAHFSGPCNTPTDDARRPYASVKDTELEAERQQQAMMEPMLPSRELDAVDALPKANLAAYATAAGLRFPDSVVAALTGVIRTDPVSPG